MRTKARSTEVVDWLTKHGIAHKVEGTWVWLLWTDLRNDKMLRDAGFRFAKSRNSYFHVSDRFLPGQFASWLHTEPVPYPPGKSYNKPGRKPGSKPKAAVVASAVSDREYEVVNDMPPPPPP